MGIWGKVCAWSAFLVVVGCGDKAATDPPRGVPSGSVVARPSTPRVDRGACRFAVEGDIERTANVAGPAFPGAEVMSRHFETDEGLRRRAEAVLAKRGVPPAERAGEIDRLVAADPPDPALGRPLLHLACAAEGVRVSFQALPTATLADLPFEPKRYALATGDDGEISAITLVDGVAYGTRDGFFELERFERDGVRAEFGYNARALEGDAEITVTGELELACRPQHGACM